MNQPSQPQMANPALQQGPGPKQSIRLSSGQREARAALEQVDTYRAAHIETATPERLLVMMYDGALKYLNLALPALRKKDLEASHRNLLKAEAILLELMSVLDMEIGGELAQNLYNLYDYMYRQLIQANLQQDPAPAQEVIKLLEPLRAAWSEAAEMVTQMRAEGKFVSPNPGAHHFAG